MQKLFTDYLIEVNYKFNAQKLLDESNRMSWKPFHYEHSLDIFKNQNNWMQAMFKSVEEKPEWPEENRKENISQYEELNRIYNDIKDITGSDVHPRFYIQSANWDLPSHTDRGMPCGFNINLTEDCGPLKFTDHELYHEEFYYKAAVINGEKRHYVPAYPKKRYVVRFAISDITYYEFVDQLKNVGLI